MPRLHILGAMKAGSTSLYYYLVKNHQLCGSLEPSFHEKEPVIWYGDRLLHRQPSEYFKSWPQIPRANCAEHVDGNPVRLKGHEAPAALHRFATASALELASIRLLAVVREPIAAYLSWYNHRLSEPKLWSKVSSSCDYAHQGLAPSFPFFTRCELDSWKRECPAWRAVNIQESTSCDYRRANNGLGMGMYAAQVSQWVHAWPRQQLLVVGFEFLSRNFSQTIRTVLSFTSLHIDKLQLDAARLPHVNSQSTACKLRTIGCDSLNALQRLFRPWNAAFNDAIARDIEDGTAPPEQMAVRLGDSTISCTNITNIGSDRWVNLSRC